VTRAAALESSEGTLPGSAGGNMSLIRGLIKSAVIVKVAQIAQRELTKPENQRKIKDGLRKVQEAAKRRTNAGS
jgi:hypothetical protein